MNPPRVYVFPIMNPPSRPTPIPPQLYFFMSRRTPCRLFSGMILALVLISSSTLNFSSVAKHKPESGLMIQSAYCFLFYFSFVQQFILTSLIDRYNA